jgi:hypothetical protein
MPNTTSQTIYLKILENPDDPNEEVNEPFGGNDTIIV